MPAQRYPLGKGMIYKVKVFEADMKLCSSICGSVHPTATDLRVPVYSAPGWLKVSKDQTIRADIGEILFEGLINALLDTLVLFYI